MYRAFTVCVVIMTLTAEFCGYCRVTYFCGKREKKYCGRFFNDEGKENVEPLPPKELKFGKKVTKPGEKNTQNWSPPL